MDDTIAAISTAVGDAGIAIIRVSGTTALAIADRLFVSRRGKPSDFPSHTIHFGTIRHDDRLADQVMLTVLRAPKTFTTEDVIEINCHGGLLTARRILALCLQAGARLAEPGEFTKRAFLNGRIDLTQAEAVMDVIHAKTDRALDAAANALAGHLAQRVNQLRDRLVTALAHIEAHLDFPEDDIAPATRETLILDLDLITQGLQELLQTFREGKILREGISVAIVGRPNVGKSSLMNALLGHERSIVTPIPGTTRDTIEDLASIRGIPIRLTDTAGIRQARGTAEKLGVARSHKSLRHSDLVIHVLDASRRFAEADRSLVASYDSKEAILVQNKIDLPRRLEIPADFPVHPTVLVSATLGKGLEELRDCIEEIALSGQVGSSNLDVAINERHADAIRRAIGPLGSAAEELRSRVQLELVSQQLRMALDALGEIVGKTTTEDILAKIFSTFCIGK